MSIIAMIFIGIVALEHLYIMYFEMFAWETIGMKTFSQFPKHLFKETKGLAANQGLYNGFLAAGLLWSLTIKDAQWASHIATYFLGCVIVAALYGGVTASKSVIIKQGIPAILALVVLYVF